MGAQIHLIRALGYLALTAVGVLTPIQLSANEGGKPICVDPTASLPPSRFPRVLEWQDMMCLEHVNRVKLLKRLALSLPADSQPQFSEFIIGKDRLPPEFKHDVPLLRVVFPEKSFFNTGESVIRPDAQEILNVIAESLRGQAPDVAIFVAGHTDNRGGEDYNYNLSVDRSNAVASRLAAAQVNGVALWRVGFGESVPLVPNDTPWNMAINRRVEFIFGARADPVAMFLQEQQKDLCAQRDAIASETCKHPPKRTEFVAEAVTTHTLVVTPVKRMMPLPTQRRGSRLATSSGTRAMEVPDPSGHEITVETPRRIVLKLAPQQRRMSMPSKF
jgi:OmpA-OmpF porin, OOP family